MNGKIVRLVFLALLASAAGAEHKNKEGDMVEARGKAKYALLIHFFYVVATKLFVLKIVYGAIFYALIVKGWHFVLWFIHYLKEKKSHKYIELDHEPYHHHDHGHYHGHEHYGHDSYGPYAYDKYGFDDDGLNHYGPNKNIMYDSDGSYSVKT